MGLMKYMKGNIKSAILGPVFIIIDTMGMISIPLFTSKIMDIGIPNSDISYIIKLGIYMTVVSLIAMIGGFLAMYFSSKASYGYGANLRKDLMKKIQEFSFSNINKFGTASLITRITNDVEVLQQLIQMILRLAIRMPVMLIGGIVMMIYMSPKIAMIFLFLIPILFITMLIVVKKGFPLFKVVQEKIDNVNNIIRENLVGARVIKSFVRQEYEIERFDKANSELMTTTIRGFNIMITIMPLVTLIMNLSIAAVLWISASGHIEIGSISASITYMTMTLLSLMMISMIFMNVSRAKASADRINAVLNEVPDIKNIDEDNEIIDGDKEESKENKSKNKEDDENDIEGSLKNKEDKVEKIDKEIIKENKSKEKVAKEDNQKNIKKMKRNNNLRTKIEKGEVEYAVEEFAFKDSNGESILNNLFFKVNAGEMVAIIGSTGTGKSTMVNLIPRFYDVTKGAIKIDGVDVRDYDLKSLRDGIGMVLQENRLFFGTIEENIRWGKKDATIEEIKHACKVAQIDEYIDNLPEKYNSMVEQRGANFSGGQKQRLAIARALVKKPKILILDDSVSALDSTTELNLRKALKEEFKDTTIFMIVQKISSCKEVDRVLVIDDGTIVGNGKHSELIKNNKIYQEISDSQKEVMPEE